MNKKENYPQLQNWMVTISSGIGIGWLIFLIIWLAFYAYNFILYKNIAVILNILSNFFHCPKNSLGSMSIKTFS